MKVRYVTAYCAFVYRVNTISGMAGTIMSTIFIGILDLQTETPVVWKKSKSRHQKSTCPYRPEAQIYFQKMNSWINYVKKIPTVYLSISFTSNMGQIVAWRHYTMVWHRNDNYPSISLSIYLVIYISSVCYYISIGRCCALNVTSTVSQCFAILLAYVFVSAL